MKQNFKQLYLLLKEMRLVVMINLGKCSARVYEELHKRFIYIFQETFNKDVFPEWLKMVKITPIFEKGDTACLTTTSHGNNL